MQGWKQFLEQIQAQGKDIVLTHSKWPPQPGTEVYRPMVECELGFITRWESEQGEMTTQEVQKERFFFPLLQRQTVVVTGCPLLTRTFDKVRSTTPFNSIISIRSRPFCPLHLVCQYPQCVVMEAPPLGKKKRSTSLLFSTHLLGSTLDLTCLN